MQNNKKILAFKHNLNIIVSEVKEKNYKTKQTTN